MLSSFAAPLALLAFDDTRNDAGTVGLILLETVMLNEALTGITKALVKHPRPYAYNQDTPEAVRTSRENTFSFFSGHTSHSAAVSFFKDGNGSTNSGGLPLVQEIFSVTLVF